MEVNNSQASTAYTTPVVDSTKLNEQNTESLKTERNTENTSAVQKPFEVNITQEAREILAAENAKAAEESAEMALEQQTSLPEPQTNQASATAQQTSQIVNIVA